MKKLLAALSLFTLILTGCTLTPQPTPPVAIYDLGLTSTLIESAITNQSPTKIPSILVAEIISPIWLNTQAIHYRLAYHNPAQLYTYANSRWAAAPAALLTRQINNHIKTSTGYSVISPTDNVQAEFTLHAILEDFSQVYDATDRSHANIHLNVTLTERRTRSLFAQHNFAIQKKASTADAAGAVSALIEASNQLNHEITEWLTNELANK